MLILHTSGTAAPPNLSTFPPDDHPTAALPAAPSDPDVPPGPDPAPGSPESSRPTTPEPDSDDPS